MGFNARKTPVWFSHGRCGWKRGGNRFLLTRTRGKEDSRALPSLKTGLSVHALHEDSKNMQAEASQHANYCNGHKKEKELFYEMMKTLFYLIIRIRLQIL